MGGEAGWGRLPEERICDQGLEKILGQEEQLQHGTVPGPASRAPANEKALVRS